MYLVGWVHFPAFGRRHPLHPSSTLPSPYLACMLYRAAWADYVGSLVGSIGPSPVGCQALPYADSAGWWDQITKWLTIEPQRAMGPMLAHCLPESGVWLQD